MFELHAGHGDAVAKPDEVVLERHLLAVVGERDHRAETIIGHRHHREVEPQARVISAVTSVSVAPSSRRAVR